jgi:hypothetical protein
MKEIYSNNWENVPNEDYERNYMREKLYLEQEIIQDSKRIGQVENDIMKLDLYDF